MGIVHVPITSPFSPRKHNPRSQFLSVSKILWFLVMGSICQKRSFYNIGIESNKSKQSKRVNRPIRAPSRLARVPGLFCRGSPRATLTFVDRRASRRAQGPSAACCVSPRLLSADSFLPSMCFTQKSIPFSIPTRFLHHFKAINYY
jgi:hypothetical protein